MEARRGHGKMGRPLTGQVSNATWDLSVSSNCMCRAVSDHIIVELTLQEQDVRKGEQTRQEIMRKAASIFNQKGYDGAALSDLMKTTGLERAESTGILGASKSLRETPSTMLGNSRWIRASKAQADSEFG
jgi:hypothetical protein